MNVRKYRRFGINIVPAVMQSIEQYRAETTPYVRIIKFRFGGRGLRHP